MTVETSAQSDAIEDALATGVRHIRTLLLTDFVDSTALLESLGDARGAAVFARSDRVVRDLVKRLDGLEIDKTDGFLLLFRRPLAAVRFSLEYHDALRRLSEEESIQLAARVGIHVDEVVLRANKPEYVARGAKPIEVEGLAKPMVARIMTLALGGQTLMTRPAFSMARRGIVGEAPLPDDVVWLEHGDYNLKGVGDPVDVCEVGVRDVAPLVAPPDSDKAWRAVSGPKREGGRFAPLLAAALGGAALVGGGLYLAQQSAETPEVAQPPEPVVAPAEPEAPEAPTTVALTITSQPTGAMVEFGGNAIGTAPVTLQLPAESALVPVALQLDGHEPHSLVCEVEAAQVSAGEATCSAVLVPVPVKTEPTKRSRRKKAPTATPEPAEQDAATTGSESARKPNIQIIE